MIIDQATEVLPFAQMLHQVAPMLRGPGCGQVWAGIGDDLGIERIPEPTPEPVRDTHQVDRQVVLGYWNQALTAGPVEMQAWTDDRGQPNSCALPARVRTASHQRRTTQPLSRHTD